MEAIGGILIVVGFILGVYCGVMLSLPRVMVTEKKEVRQGKLTSITFMCVLSVTLVMIGQFLFFKFGH